MGVKAAVIAKPIPVGARVPKRARTIEVGWLTKKRVYARLPTRYADERQAMPMELCRGQIAIRPAEGVCACLMHRRNVGADLRFGATRT
jgi:hypothetical protein